MLEQRLVTQKIENPQLEERLKRIIPGIKDLSIFSIIEGHLIVYKKDDKVYCGKLHTEDELGLLRYWAEREAYRTLNGRNMQGVVRLVKYYDHMHLLIFENETGGDLDVVFEKRGRAFTPSQAISIIAYLASTLDYMLVEHKMTHGDVKLENVLVSDGAAAYLTSQDDSKQGLERVIAPGFVKLSDFSYTRINGESQVHEFSEGQVPPRIYGTRVYISPEEWRREPVFNSDVYKLGVMLYLMLQGDSSVSGPNNDRDLSAQLRAQEKLKIKPEILEEWYGLDEFARSMISWDYKIRPSLQRTYIKLLGFLKDCDIDFEKLIKEPKWKKAARKLVHRLA